MDQAAILIIDDEPNNFDVIETFLSDQDYRLYYMSSGKHAIASLDKFQPDLILLDVMMPVMDGIEVCQRIKRQKKWQSIPIIMVTALTQKSDLARCLECGAEDFISKPVSRIELMARVRSMLRIRQQHQKLESFNAELEATVEQRTAELQQMLYRDSLTQLPSRNLLLKQLTTLWEAGKSGHALIYLDCDQFKLVNSSFGYTVSNQLLVAIGQRLLQLLGPDDLLARMGEDEFCFLLRSISTKRELEHFLDAVLLQFEAPFTVDTCEIFITACMGAAWSQHMGWQPESLIQDADTAMYQAKLRGRGHYQIFNEEMHQLMFERLMLESDLQRALELEEFELRFQPIVHMQSQQLYGFEALVRWLQNGQDVISPETFIPCMEATGLIIPLGMWIFEQACRQLHRWHQAGWPDLTMSINLSARQFASATLLADIDRILRDTSVNPSRIKLEITESAVMENDARAITITQALRSKGMQISLDDFGTGYSSLGYLHRFPADNLKIDRSFLSELPSMDKRGQVINTIVALSKRLNLSVIVEGIETTEQLQWLQQLNCEWGQGYLFAPPLSSQEVEERYFHGKHLTQNAEFPASSAL